MCVVSLSSCFIAAYGRDSCPSTKIVDQLVFAFTLSFSHFLFLLGLFLPSLNANLAVVSWEGDCAIRRGYACYGAGENSRMNIVADIC